MGKESKTILELDRITPAETDQVPVARPGTTGDNKFHLGDLISFNQEEKKLTLYGRYILDVSRLLSYRLVAESDDITKGSVALTVNGVVTDNVQIGDTVVVTASALSGNNFSHWLDSGGNIIAGAGSTFTFTFAADSPTEFHAVFETIVVDPRTVSVESDDNTMGSAVITYSGEDKASVTVDEGTSVLLKATALEGYAFVCWKKGDEVLDWPPEHDLTVTEDATYIAVFEEKNATRFIGFTNTPSETGSNITEKYRNLGLNELLSCKKVEARKGEQKEYTLLSSEIGGNQKKMFFILWKGDNKPVRGSLYRSFDQTTETYTQNQIISEENNTYFTVHKTFDNGNGEIYHLAGKIELFGNDTLTIQF